MITENYIKMCEQAREIQDSWEQKDGDCFIAKRGAEENEYVNGIISKDYEDVCNRRQLDYPWYGDDIRYRNIVYLPTQEQLFDMLLKWCQTNKILHHLLAGESINLYILKEIYNYANSFDGIIFINDMKALTLSYIYQRKYNKTWTGKKWEEIKNKEEKEIENDNIKE